MKRALILMTALMIGAGSLSSQELRPAIRAGARSLNFTFGGFGTFGFGGAGINGGISYSHFLSSDAAYRTGLQASYTSTTAPWNDNTNPGADGKSWTLGLGLGFDYLMYMESITTRVRPYWGPGVFVLYSSSSVKPAAADNAGTGTLVETKNGNTADGLTIGLQAVIGAEFFLYSDLSFSAEYQLNLVSSTMRSDRTVVRKNLPDAVTKQGSTLQILGFGAAGAGVHFYF